MPMTFTPRWICASMNGICEVASAVAGATNSNSQPSLLAGVLEAAGDAVEVRVAGVLADIDDLDGIGGKRAGGIAPGRAARPASRDFLSTSFLLLCAGFVRRYAPLPLGAGIDEIGGDDGDDQQDAEHRQLDRRQAGWRRSCRSRRRPAARPRGRCRGSCRGRRRCRCRRASPSAPSAIRRRARGRSAPSRGATRS